MAEAWSVVGTNHASLIQESKFGTYFLKRKTKIKKLFRHGLQKVTRGHSFLTKHYCLLLCDLISCSILVRLQTGKKASTDPKNNTVSRKRCIYIYIYSHGEANWPLSLKFFMKSLPHFWGKASPRRGRHEHPCAVQGTTASWSPQSESGKRPGMNVPGSSPPGPSGQTGSWKGDPLERTPSLSVKQLLGEK